MIRLTDTEVTRFSQMRDQANASEIGYWEIYKAIADLLQSKYAVASTDSSVLWLRGATEANADRGAFSALIRGYTESQYQLRYGTAIPTGKLQKASNEVAKNLLKDLLGDNDQVGQPDRWPKGQVPDINRIAFADATAVGDVLFNKTGDTSAPPINSAWSGSLLFSLLRSDQTNRLMQGGGDPAKIDTLNDWRDVLYAYRSYEAGFVAARSAYLFESQEQALVDTTILGTTALGYINGPGTLQSLQDAVVGGTPNPTLKEAFSVIGNVGQNKFLDMLMGAIQGKNLLGITTDDNFSSAAQAFFGALSPEQLQAIEAKTLPKNATDISALAQQDTQDGASARAALLAGSFIRTSISNDVANSDALKLHNPANDTGSLTEQWIDDRSLFVLALGTGKPDTGRQLWNSLHLPTDRSYEFQYADFSGTIQILLAENTARPGGVTGTGLVPSQLIAFGGAGNDTIGGSESIKFGDRLYGGAGNDTISAGKGDDYLEGNAGNDRLIGGTGTDKLTGGDDSDILLGGADNDELAAGTGNDVLYGGTGDDTLDGGDGNDFLNGGAGIDTLSGGENNDYLYDQGGSDQTTLKGDGGNDILEVKGGSGITLLGGGTGNDILKGGTGSNSLDGGDGNDVITGGDDYDIINGGDDADVIEAGGGADLINGGAGADYLKGGAGNDQYIYDSAGFGTDLIEDSTGTLAGKTGGAYDDKSLAYVGGGFEYRKYTMGSMKRICYKKRSCLRCISLGYRLKRHAKSLSAVSAGSKEAVA